MKNLKFEKWEIIEEVAKKIANLEKGELNAKKIEAEEKRRLVNNYCTTDQKEFKNYINKEILAICGNCENFGRFSHYMKSYENIEMRKIKIINVTNNFLILENKERIRKDRFYAIIKK